MRTKIPVENGETLAALQGFLGQLLESQVVDALLVPMRTPGGSVSLALVRSADFLSAADPLAPVMPSNGATWAGKLSVREPRVKVGAVLRSCELRALVELVKLQQASLDDLVLIGVDCAGTLKVPAFQGQREKGVAALWRELYEAASSTPGNANHILRQACQICDQPVYDQANIKIELLGSDLDQAIYLSLDDDLGDRLGLAPAESESGDRDQLIQKLVAARTEARDAEYASIRQRLEGDEGLIGVFDGCIRCHNCMNVCPICYCKTCVFKSPIFDHEPMQYANWAAQKGAHRMPGDMSLFHLTRLNHMGLSCVGCGMCTQACPADLPVGTVFRAIGQRLREVFDYLPGRSVEEPLPLITFKENEWTEVGE
jgi:formate dehydrogenase subunit beta